MADEEYPDDPSIPDEMLLWRRIDRAHLDENDVPRRISFRAFQDSSDGTPMSVTLGLPERDPFSVLTKYPEQGLVEFTARHVRELGFRVARAPVAADPHQVYVAGPKKTRPVRK